MDIVVKARRLNDIRNEDTLSIHFAVETQLTIPSNDVTVNGAQTADVPLIVHENKATGRATLTIACVNRFGTDLHINAYIVDATTNRRALVGRMIILANHEIRVTDMTPVIVRIDKEKIAKDGKIQPVPSYDLTPANLEPAITSAATFMNNKAFNQAYIYLNPQPTQTLDIPAVELGATFAKLISENVLSGTDTQKYDFANHIEHLYNKIQNRNDVEERRKEAKRISQINEKIKALPAAFHTEYTKARTATMTAQDYYNYTPPANGSPPAVAIHTGVVTATWNHADVQTAYNEYLTALRQYKNLLQNDAGGQIPLNQLQGLDKTGKVYVFYFGGINNATPLKGTSSEDASVPAFSQRGDGNAFIYYDMINGTPTLPTRHTSGLIAHEVGHALSLKHIFNAESNGDVKKYKQDGRRDANSVKEIITILKAEKAALKTQKRELTETITTPESVGAYKFNCDQLAATSHASLLTNYEFDNNSDMASDKIIQEIERNINKWFLSPKDQAIAFEALPAFPADVVSVPLAVPPQDIAELDTQIANIQAQLDFLTKEQSTVLPEIKLNPDTTQAATNENIMDYYQKTGSEGEGETSFDFKVFLRFQWQMMQAQAISYRILGVILLFILTNLFPNNTNAQETTNLYFQDTPYTKGDKIYYVLEIDTLQKKGIFYYRPYPEYKLGFFMYGFTYKYRYSDRSAIEFIPDYYVFQLFSIFENNKIQYTTEVYRKLGEFSYFRDTGLTIYNDEEEYRLKRADYAIYYNIYSWEDYSWDELCAVTTGRRGIYSIMRAFGMYFPSTMKPIKKIKWKKFTQEQREVIKEHRAKYFSPSFNIYDMD